MTDIPNTTSPFAFPRSFRGYNPRAVEEHIRGLEEKIASLAERNAALETRLSAFRDAEEKLVRLLERMDTVSTEILERSKASAAAIAAQAEHERSLLRTQAREEASVIIRDAERRAEAIIEEAHRKRAAVLEEMTQLFSRRAVLIARIKAVLSSQLEFLRALEEEASDPGRETAPIAPTPTADAGIGAAELTSILQAIEASEDRSHA
ncbi:MAG: DivIVA domain-containing protein [Bacteroidota bacterium]|nr:DivIVA domain-containing protein [Bacteroidota bacterium]